MAKIKLTPEELLAQSAELASLQTEFQTLFSQVTSALNSLNGSWSEALAGNFSGKIAAAQKSFASVADMLQNGADAAKRSGCNKDQRRRICGAGYGTVDVMRRKCIFV